MFQQKFNKNIQNTCRSDLNNQHVVLNKLEDQHVIDQLYQPKLKNCPPQNRFNKETEIIQSEKLGCHDKEGKNGYSRNHGGLFYIR